MHLWYSKASGNDFDLLFENLVHKGMLFARSLTSMQWFGKFGVSGLLKCDIIRRAHGFLKF